jgi:hypothetical protein
LVSIRTPSLAPGQRRFPSRQESKHGLIPDPVLKKKPPLDRTASK